MATREEALAALAAKPAHERAWIAARIAAKKDGIDLGGALNNHIRSTEEQQALYDNRANNPNPVAKPGTSHHEASVGGDAWDVNEGPARDWLMKRGAEFGLFNNVEGDAPHFQYFPKDKRERPTPKPRDGSSPKAQSARDSAAADALLAASPKPPSQLESAGRGAAQGATLKFGDEIQGLVQATGNKLLPTWLGGRDSAEPQRSFIDDYRYERDVARAENEAAEAANPKTYLASEVAGALPSTALVPAGKAGAGLGAAVAHGARTGAGIGAVLGLGGSEAELTNHNIENDMRAMEDIGKGAAWGGALGAAAPVVALPITKAASAIGTRLGDFFGKVASPFGYEAAPNVGRAASTLGVKPGQAASEEFSNRLTDVLKPEDLPVSAFENVSPSAPDALAAIAKNPRVQVAQQAGKDAARQALGSLGDMDWSEAPQLFKALAAMSKHKLPTQESAGLIGNLFRKAGGTVMGNNANLARVMGNPQAKAELAELLARGRDPNLTEAAAMELASRISALIGADEALDTQP